MRRLLLVPAVLLGIVLPAWGAAPSSPSPAAGLPAVPGVDVNRLLEQMTRGAGPTPAPARGQAGPAQPLPPPGTRAEEPSALFERIVRQTLWDGRLTDERREELRGRARELGLDPVEAEAVVERVAEERAELVQQVTADVDVLRDRGALSEADRSFLETKWTDRGLPPDEVRALIDHALGVLRRQDVYRSVLEAFWEDGVLTSTEQEEIERKREELGLTEEEHQRILEEVKAREPDKAMDVLAGLRERARASRLDTEDLELYGRELFREAPGNFLPSQAGPPPDTYRIGPGDRFRVSLWGRMEAEYDLEVDPEGRVQFPKVGPVSLAGLTYAEARGLLKARAESITGVSAAVSLVQIRPVQVFVVGEVEKPGSVTLSPLSTVIHAVMAAGGPTPLGSLRKVLLRRRAKVISTLDLYGFLQEGRAEGDRPLETGDVVVVPKARRLVRLAGKVKRPAVYEILPGEGIRALLGYAGGLTPDAYGGRVQVERARDHESRIVLDVSLPALEGDFPLEDGDTVRVFALSPEIENRISVFGHVYRPGVYSWRPGLRVSDVLGTGGNLKPGVDLDYAVVLRETGPDRAKSVLPFRLGKALDREEPGEDLLLRPGDEIYVFSAEQFRPPLSATATGLVRRPGRYRIERGARVADLVRLAGGLAPEAFLQKAELLRYLPDRSRKTLYVSLEAALRGIPGDNLELQDGDELVVHSVWDAGAEPVVLIEGEVQGIQKSEDLRGRTVPERFESTPLPAPGEEGRDETQVAASGAYGPDQVPPQAAGAAADTESTKKEEEKPEPLVVPLTRGMTVRDLIFKAGGLTKDAYLGAAQLYRTDPVTKETTIHTFDLGKALEGDPAHDLRLQDLDHVVVHSAYDFRPVQPVVVTGMVTSPGTYPYATNMRVRDLVLAAGGLKEEAYLGGGELVRMEVVDGGEEARTHTIRFSLERAMAGDPEHNIPLRPYDKVLIKRIPEWRDTWMVEVLGEVRFPGAYYIAKGEKLSSVIRRAGGYTPDAYLRGAVFTRESARVRQQERLDELRDRLQQMILRASSEEVISALSPEDVAAQKQYLAAQEQLLKKLKAARATGRVVIRLLPLEELEGSEWDIALEDGDRLTVPKIPQTVSVVGAVYNPTSLLWEPDNRAVEHYLQKTGGPTPDAEESEIYVVRADGTVVSSRSMGGRGWWTPSLMGMDLYPGDTILVPEKVVRVSYMKELKDITQILYQIAVTAGVAVALF